MHRLMIAAAIFALSAGAASAQAPAGGGQWGPGGMLAAADANHDGTITRAEFDASRASRFATRDANHDGSLTGDEMPRWGGGGQTGAPAGAPSGEHRGPASADTNNDGTITRAEYDAAGTAMFTRLDADHNGSISSAEVAAMQARMQQH